MLLAINANNTTTKFGVFDGDAKRGAWQISTNASRTADEYAFWLTGLMALAGLRREDIDGVILANVVPQTAFPLRSLCRTYFGGDPMVVGEQGCDPGIRILIDRPEEAGADRIANAVAARNRYATPAVVIDLGTATTFDVIDADGNYCGGIISPGISLSFEALYNRAAKLPRVEIRRPRRAIGRSTVEAMQSGIYWGYIGLIEGALRRIEDETGLPHTVIGTGGLVPLIADGTPAIHHVDQDLTLLGLVDIHRRNRG
ncbi:MAG: type III pantothenate kinase [Alphaproteobacteria bacterium]|nr:type III pantothenate kinase [Alphaproteobacteria bacterium]